MTRGMVQSTRGGDMFTLAIIRRCGTLLQGGARNTLTTRRSTGATSTCLPGPPRSVDSPRRWQSIEHGFHLPRSPVTPFTTTVDADDAAGRHESSSNCCNALLAAWCVCTTARTLTRATHTETRRFASKPCQSASTLLCIPLEEQ